MSRLSVSLAAALLAATGALPLWAADARQEAIDRDHALTKGTWRIVALVVNGNTVNDDDARKITVVNGAQGDWELLVDGNRVARGTSTIDPTTTPKEIDATVTEGDGVGRKTLGIYETGEKTRPGGCATPPPNGPAPGSSPPIRAASARSSSSNACRRSEPGPPVSAVPSGDQT
ncbi:MAG: TIGR03067 domain-containing protein [Planctomycetia bacterium]|nr:TIGR03067 domain-containing protein [Planctomycetia bacterium]